MYVLQTIDVILAWLCAEDEGARRRIKELLAERDERLGDVKGTLQGEFDLFSIIIINLLVWYGLGYAANMECGRAIG